MLAYKTPINRRIQTSPSQIVEGNTLDPAGRQSSQQCTWIGLRWIGRASVRNPEADLTQRINAVDPTAVRNDRN
jgi:hypothetical protein